jgi:hypothetical protein
MPTRASGLAALALLTIAALAAGCKEEQAAPRRVAPSGDAGAPSAPRPRSGRLSPEEEATIETVMDARDEIARIAETHAGNCDLAAREIASVVERSRPLLAASSALERDPVKRQLIGDAFGARMLASSSKLMGLIEACDEHEGLARIFETLE